jgi:tRNAThr (cytosine32-N3)-methyltransferase
MTDELAILFTGSTTSGLQDKGTNAGNVNHDIAEASPHALQMYQAAYGDTLSSSPLGVTPTHPRFSANNRTPHPLFAIEQLGVDRRLLVNRKRQQRMYRVWLQGKFRKLEESGIE